MNQIQRNARCEIIGLKRIKIAVNLITYFLIPFLIAVTVGYKVELEEASIALYRSLLIVLILVQLIFGTILIFLDSNLAIEAFFYTKDISEENERIKIENINLIKNVEYLNLLQNTIQGFREIESQFIKQNEEDLLIFIDITFSLIVDIREQLFDFKANELWNFAVYLYNPNSIMLEVVWRKKHHNHPSQGEERKWKPGQGHVGKAFIDGTAKITGNALDPSIATLMSPPPSLVRDYDPEVYRSFASIPIITDLHGINYP